MKYMVNLTKIVCTLSLLAIFIVATSLPAIAVEPRCPCFNDYRIVGQAHAYDVCESAFSDDWAGVRLSKGDYDKLISFECFKEYEEGDPPMCRIYTTEDPANIQRIVETTLLQYEACRTEIQEAISALECD